MNTDQIIEDFMISQERLRDSVEGLLRIENERMEELNNRLEREIQLRQIERQRQLSVYGRIVSFFRRGHL